MTVNVYDLYKVFLGALVELAAAVAGVGKGFQTNMGDGADVVGCNIAVHVGNNTLRQVICLNLVVECQFTQTRRTVPVAADNTLYHTLVSIVVAASAVAVSLTSCKKQRQIVRVSGFQKTLLQCSRQGFWACTAYKTASGNGVTILYKLCSFLC